MSDQTQQLLSLLESSGPSLHALLLRLTLRQDAAEELMQELFVRLQRAAGFSKASDPVAYAARTAINLAMQWRRATARRKLITEIPDGLTVDGPSPLDGMEQAEDLERVIGAISRLRGSSREAFVLRYVQQQSFEQVARQLGRTEHQVRALCSKAVGQLGRLMESTRS